MTGLGRRSGRKESQYGILIRMGKGKRWQPVRWCERCVCLTMFALCSQACVLPSPPDFGNLIWGMLTRTKDGMEQNMVSISQKKKKRVWGGKNGLVNIGSCFCSFIQLVWSSGKLRALMQLSSQHFSKSDIHLFLLTG